MFTFNDLKQTRFYQDVQEEVQRDTILRLLSRKFGQISPEIALQIEALANPQLEELTDALLDFTNLNNLKTWLRENT